MSNVSLLTNKGGRSFFDAGEVSLEEALEQLQAAFNAPDSDFLNQEEGGIFTLRRDKNRRDYVTIYLFSGKVRYVRVETPNRCGTFLKQLIQPKFFFDLSFEKFRELLSRYFLLTTRKEFEDYLAKVTSDIDSWQTRFRR